MSDASYTLRKQLMDESYQHSMDWIEEEKYYNRMSLSDELAAYKRVQSRYAKGTDERQSAAYFSNSELLMELRALICAIADGPIS